MVHIGRAILAVIVIVIIAVVAVLATPIVLAGGSFSVPVTKITFNESTASGSLVLPIGCHNCGFNGGDYPASTNSTTTTNVYSYYYMQRGASWFQTTDNQLNATSAGTVNLNFTMVLSGPNGGQTLPMQQLTGVALGNRTHTIYLSVDQGVKASGNYQLTITIDWAKKLAGATSYTTGSPKGLTVNFKVP